MKIRVSREIVEIGNVIFVMSIYDWIILAGLIITPVFILLFS